jgi:hypothetical protein
MLFLLISQIPLITVNSPESLVNHNRLVVLIGLAIYASIGALIHYGKMPATIMGYLPTTDLKYLVGLIALDYIIYFTVHKFQYGFPPPLSVSVLERQKLEKEKEKEDDEIICEKTMQIEVDYDDDSTLTGNNVPTDDLSSSLKEPGRVRPPPVTVPKSSGPSVQRAPLKSATSSTKMPPNHVQMFKPPRPPDINLGETQDLEEPNEEASLHGGNYFRDDDSRPAVENWDTEDFTHEEYVPENDD